MSEPIGMSLPWAVLATVNDRKGIVGQANRARSRRYREAMEKARVLVASQTRRAPFLTGPVEVRLHFYPPDQRRRDPDNLLKMIHDSMIGIVFDDDSRIRRQAWEIVRVDRSNPRVEITVLALETPHHGARR